MSGDSLSRARVLVTGSQGFVGRHLRRAFADAGAEVFGLDRTAGDEGFHGDLRSEPFVANVLATVRPTHVVHLAGAIPRDGVTAVEMYEENVLNTVRLLEAIRVSGLRPRVVVASSSAVYGHTSPSENPLSETHAFRPCTDYGSSKVAQEMSVLQHAVAYGLAAIRVRTFNLVGPGQPPQMLLPSLARQVADAEQISTAGPVVIRAGALDSRRDFTDVRDAARAYVALAERGAAGAVYNVCTGRGRSPRECVEVLGRLAGRAIHAESDAALVRRIEVREQVGNPALLMESTGWRPAIPFEDSVRDVLDEWRARARADGGVAR